MTKLLIVDDETDIREFAANYFKKRKINVATAASGEEALLLLEKESPQLVLLDIKMEGIDGIETLRRIKQKNSAIKIIMVTGRKPEEENTFIKCKELGAIDYIHKPLELDELEKVVLSQITN